MIAEIEKNKYLSEIQQFNNQLMKIKDENMDQEAQVEKRFEKEKFFKEEIVLLKGVV